MRKFVYTRYQKDCCTMLFNDIISRIFLRLTFKNAFVILVFWQSVLQITLLQSYWMALQHFIRNCVISCLLLPFSRMVILPHTQMLCNLVTQKQIACYVIIIIIDGCLLTMTKCPVISSCTAVIHSWLELIIKMNSRSSGFPLHTRYLHANASITFFRGTRTSCLYQLSMVFCHVNIVTLLI